ncbi:MAG: hypothetical protein LBT19_02070 [Candidatus Nomurabacteria bacterium]|jgi:hypothetical protein|nr:hypothetical protein [Candidatus Nomurabacteria bacterium]
MDDFQRDFMRKVKTPTVEGEVVGAPNSPRKPIDKRWFILGGLILLLIIIFVTLLIISNSNNNNNTTSEPDVYQTDIIGEWSCTDGLIMSFYSDKTYIWTNISTDFAESGNFSEDNGVLSIERLAYIVNGNFVQSNEKNFKYNIAYNTDHLALKQTNGSNTYSCTENKL